MKKGEIWVVEIPAINGYEQHGIRPVVLVANCEANIVTIIPLTTSRAALKFLHVIGISPDDKNNLNGYSIALIFQLRALDQKRLIKKVGVLNQDYITQIDKNIINMLSLI